MVKARWGALAGARAPGRGGMSHFQQKTTGTPAWGYSIPLAKLHCALVTEQVCPRRSALGQRDLYPLLIFEQHADSPDALGSTGSMRNAGV